MPSPRRHHPRRALGPPVAGLVALALTGCVGAPASTPPPSSSASTEPVFASDEEALAAAEAAYEAYRAASAEVSSEGGAGADRVVPFVSERFAPVVLDEFSALQAAGLRMVGSTAIDSVSLADWSSFDGSAEVTMYLCRDVSGARAVNAHGEDVTPAERDDRVPLQAHLVSGGTDPAVLVVDGVEQWSGNDFC